MRKLKANLVRLILPGILVTSDSEIFSKKDCSIEEISAFRTL